MSRLWDKIKNIFKDSKKKVKILTPNIYNDTLNNINVNENSALAEVITNTAGIIIDNYRCSCII